MKRSIACLAVLVLAAGAGVLVSSPPPPTPADPKAPDMKEMMEKAKKFMQPGPNHKHLERFLGRWDSESRLFSGEKGSPPEKGTAEVSWLMEGRWLKFEGRGTLMGMPAHHFMLLGYDNFKMSFVTTAVSSLDTAMTHSEGDLDPSGKALLTYGTLDEYLTGEHDKMVKYVWRFDGPDRMALEVHDLPIGEKGTKVLETTYTRRKA